MRKILMMSARLIIVLAFAIGAAPVSAVGLFISSSDTDNVLQFDSTTGAFVQTFVVAGSGGLDNPGGLAFGPDGNLYVASRATGQVLRYNGATGVFINTFVTAASGGLGQPLDLAFGPDGHLYVSDLTGVAPDNILRYNGTTGAFIDIFAVEPTFNTPRHIEFAGNVLWAAGEADRIWRFDATTGAFLNKPQSDNPRGLAAGADGRMYVSTSFSGVFRHDLGTGTLVDTFIPGLLPLGDNDIVFGPDGNLYASGDRVRRFDAITGAFIDDFVAAGSGGLSVGRYLVFGPASTVPEPGTLCLIAAGIAGLMGCRRLPWRPFR